MDIEKSWPAGSVEMIDITHLSDADQNSRTHTAEQIEQIAASMDEFGWTIPVLVDEDNVLIAGHARIAAARLRGLTDVPCMRATGWSDAKKEAYQIADNQLALNSTWDTAILGAQLKRLKAFNFNMEVLGLDTTMMQLEAFKPNFKPTTGKSPVTAEDMAKKNKDLTGQYEAGSGTVKESYEIICPYCHKEFEVEI